MSNLTAEQRSLYDLIVQSIQRDVNRLEDAGTDRVSKRRALESIEKVIFGSEKAEDIYIVLFDTLGATLLKMSVDSVEKCRELSVKIIAKFMKSEKVSPISHVLKVLNVAKDRLTGANIENVEEIRLEWIEACGEIIKQGRIEGDQLNTLVEILQASLQDSFPELKKRSVQLVIELGREIGKNLRLHAQPLIKALIPSLAHRHSSVRILTLQALQVLIELDIAGLDLVLDHLHKLIFDKSASVREVLYTVVKEWIYQRSGDKSSFKILPILLAGISDEVMNLQSLCRQYLCDLGQAYSGGDVNPDLSAQALVRDSVQYTLPLILEDSQHWSATNRALALKVLDTFIEYARDAIESYTALVLQNLYVQVQHKDSTVVGQGIKCAETLGRFVNPAIYAHLTMQQVKLANEEVRASFLMILAAFIRGSSFSQLNEISPWLVESLCDKKLIREDECLQRVVDIAYSLVTKMSEENISLSKSQEGYKLFYLFLTLQNDQQSAEKVTSGISFLATAHGLTDPSDLYSMYFDDLLVSLRGNEHKWAVNSMELRIFRHVLIGANNSIENHLESIFTSLKNLTDVKKEVELRISVFQTMTNIFGSFNKWDRYTIPIIFDIILPNLEYRPPQKTPGVRAAAMESLYALVESNSSSANYTPEQSNQLVMVLCQALEDEIPETRFKSLKLLQVFTKESSTKAPINNLIFIMYPEILKRLDDAQDEVRNEAVFAVAQLMELISPEFEEKHVETILKVLMLQLNDDNFAYQNKIIAVLTEASKKFPSQTQLVAKAVRPILQNTNALDQIQAGL
ncbi:hypothetical protein K7432_014239 [Basidiobolus ranarum]|uniref:Uncharacterized protein n=1 Tax=Basidiobolus ranarum TaxID=34480 RepID=A0ABR2VPR5_9FUNG